MKGKEEITEAEVGHLMGRWGRGVIMLYANVNKMSLKDKSILLSIRTLLKANLSPCQSHNRHLKFKILS